MNVFWHIATRYSSRTSPCGVCSNAQANSEVPLGFSGGSVPENVHSVSPNEPHTATQQPSHTAPGGCSTLEVYLCSLPGFGGSAIDVLNDLIQTVETNNGSCVQLTLAFRLQANCVRVRKNQSENVLAR